MTISRRNNEAGKNAEFWQKGQKRCKPKPHAKFKKAKAGKPAKQGNAKKTAKGIQGISLKPFGEKAIGVTPAVRNYVGFFKARNLKGIGLVRAIAGGIAGFKETILPKKEAREKWGKRSAEEILLSREVFQAERKKGEPVTIEGCTERAIALVSCLRHLGIPVLVARAQTHTYVKFFYLGSVWAVNPPGTKKGIVRKMTRADIRLENWFRQEKAFAEGLSLKDIGMESYGDFFKFEA